MTESVIHSITKEEKDQMKFDEAMEEFLKVHDERIISETFMAVLHLLDIMEIADSEKLEFAELTEKGRYAKEGHDIAIRRIRKQILSVVMDIHEGGGKHFKAEKEEQVKNSRPIIEGGEQYDNFINHYFSHYTGNRGSGNFLYRRFVFTIQMDYTYSRIADICYGNIWIDQVNISLTKD